MYSTKGSFAPLCSAMGGFVGQQVLTSITGKFTPIQQWVKLISFHFFLIIILLLISFILMHMN